MDINTIPLVEIAHVRCLQNIDFIDNDFAIFDDISELPVRGYPSRMNASVVSLCLKGSYTVSINLHEYTLTTNTLLITLPDQIVQNISKSDDFAGVFIVVSKGFIDDTLPHITQMLTFMFDVKENPALVLAQEDVDCLLEYHSFLWKRVRMPHNIYRKEIAQSILLSLFYELHHIYQRCMPQKLRVMTRKEELMEKFLREVAENYRTERAVSYYADKLCLTAKHLSAVVKEVSGKTAGKWIDDFVILEAKALLMSSEMSIQEIAEVLHFANQSFFGKYFKHAVGLSPREYRKR